GEVGPGGAGEALLRELQREERRAHVAGELELLRGDGEHLLDLGELPFVPVARKLLVKRFERELLALGLGEARLELRELGPGFALRLFRLARHAARLPGVGL